MKLLPEHIRSARGLLNITQSDLATAAGVSPTTIRNFENETAEPSEDTILRITMALEQLGIEFLNSGQPGVRRVKRASSGE